MADDKLYLQFKLDPKNNGSDEILKELEKLKAKISKDPIKVSFTTDGALKDLDKIQNKLSTIKTMANSIHVKVNDPSAKKTPSPQEIAAAKAKADKAKQDAFYKNQIAQLNKIPAKHATATKAMQKYRKEWELLSKDTKRAIDNITSNKNNYQGRQIAYDKDGKLNPNALLPEHKAKYDELNALFTKQEDSYLKAEAVMATLNKAEAAFVKTVGKYGHILNKDQYEQYIGNFANGINTINKNADKYTASIGNDLFETVRKNASEAIQVFDTVATHQKNLSNEFAPVNEINKADAAYQKLSNTIKDYIGVNEKALTKLGTKSGFENLLKQVDAKEIKNIADAQRRFEELKVDNKQKQQSFDIDKKNIATLNKIPNSYEQASKAMQKYRQEYRMLIKTYEMDKSRILRDEKMYTKGITTGNEEDLNAIGKSQFDEATKGIKLRQEAYMKQEELFARISKINRARELALDGKDSFTNVAEIEKFKSILRTSFGKQEGTNVFESLTKDAKGLNEEISRLNVNKNKLETFTKDFKKIRGDDIKFGSLSGTMSDYIQDYQKALKSAKLLGQATDLQGRINKRDFPDFKTAAAEVENFKMQARLAGVESDKFLGKFDKTLGARIRSSMAGMSVFYAQDAFRQMFENVKQVDAAMTELKKVTDETADTYDKFLSNASDRAQQIGASLVETIQATADYSRLGYNLNDATKLADSALVYRNVGDDIKSMEDASASLISTMQGFHIEAQDSMSIVDKFNEVSNSFATSSGDIGEGIKRSAAAMYAAGNDLDQTIGLFTGAQTIVQDKLLSPYVVICR